MKERVAHTAYPWGVVREAGANNRQTYRLTGTTLQPYDTTICQHVTKGRSPHTEACFARIVACVNALEGMDPEAVGEVVEAARALRDDLDFMHASADGMAGYEDVLRSRDTLTKALAKFEGRS